MKKLHDAFLKALDDPKVAEIMDRYDFIRRYMNAEDYKKFVPTIVAGEKAALEKMGMLKKE